MAQCQSCVTEKRNISIFRYRLIVIKIGVSKQCNSNLTILEVEKNMAALGYYYLKTIDTSDKVSKYLKIVMTNLFIVIYAGHSYVLCRCFLT